MKRIETSKKILIFCDTLTTLSVFSAFAVALSGNDTSGLSEIAVAVVGLSATAHGFYFWKAKAENLHKFKQDDKITMGEGNTWENY